VAESEDWSQHKGSGGSREVELGEADPRLKPGVLGHVLLAWLSLINTDLIPCFPACLQVDLVLQPRPFYRDALSSEGFSSHLCDCCLQISYKQDLDDLLA